jgi:hypothetical protein
MTTQHRTTWHSTKQGPHATTFCRSTSMVFRTEISRLKTRPCHLWFIPGPSQPRPPQALDVSDLNVNRDSSLHKVALRAHRTQIMRARHLRVRQACHSWVPQACRLQTPRIRHSPVRRARRPHILRMLLIQYNMLRVAAKARWERLHNTKAPMQTT